MLSSREKISIRQAMIILLVILFAPTIRAIPSYTAAAAKQSAWLSPIITLFITIPIIFIVNSIYKAYKNESFIEVIEDILGKIPGKAIAVFYIVQLTILVVANIRSYSEGLVSSIFPNVKLSVFSAVMLITVAMTIRKGIVVITRICEIINKITLPTFLIIAAFSFKNIKLERITPISHLDFFPLMKANISILAAWSHFLYLFLFGEYINNKEKLKKECTKTIILITILTMLAIALTIGLLGASTVELSPNAYILAVKQVSIFGAIERIEAAIISLLIFADYMIISILLFTILNLYKLLFKLDDTKPLINIYLIIIFFLVEIVSRNQFEMKVFVDSVVVPLNIFLGFIFPVVVFIVGKIRRKI